MPLSLVGRIQRMEEHPPHAVSKLYYLAWTSRKWSAYQAALKKLTSKVDGIERQATPWPEWAVTTVIDTSRYSDVVWRAVSCHESQMSVYQHLQNLAPEQHRSTLGDAGVLSRVQPRERRTPGGN